MFIDPAKTLIYYKDIRKHETKPGLSTILQPDGRVFSCGTGGAADSRPENYDGQAESAEVSGALATYRGPDNKLWTFAIAPAGNL